MKFVNQASRRIQRENGISRWRQFTELGLLFVLRRLGPVMYYEARLWRPEYSLADKMAFFNGEQYLKRLNLLNPPAYRKFSQHKVAEKALLQLARIPTPAFVGFFHSYKGYAADGRPLCRPGDLQAVLRERAGQILCFKHTEGWGGSGFVAARIRLSHDDITLEPLDKTVALSVEQFVQTHMDVDEGILIEEFFIQHPMMAGFNPTSVNTLRIWVRQSATGVEILGSILRVGRQGALVDNAGQGGFVVKIDMASGRLIQAMSCEVIPQLFTEHPDTGVPLTGCQLPFWAECLELAGNALRAFPHAHFTGLDMAIGKDGPVIIELNLEPDKVTARNFDMPMARLLG
ncbi:sugar-transfer associated ATP-grasp domain-containing protein [Bowmanella dokdonensis]|uniref:Alpha-L-glutamate ligase-related protein ATP-grasp domain-containing protein n=1 Tax=Bowmanella dokdonensis TaxID=751969 RepID=A0A939DM13_9ALTE|nr:hypothetical protein [Bowmanella dokdonensis]